MLSNKKKLLNVLLLDDEPQILNLNEQLLYENFGVFKAQNIREAETVLDKQAIHILVSDHYLGNENGLNFLKQLHKEKPEIIKIVLSSCTCHEVILQSHNSEAIFRYLTKPCLNEDLLENIKLAEIAWEIKQCEKQLKNEHQTLSETFKDVNLIKIKKQKQLGSIKKVTSRTLRSIIYLCLALIFSGTFTLIILYCLKSFLGFDIFK